MTLNVQLERAADALRLPGLGHEKIMPSQW